MKVLQTHTINSLVAPSHISRFGFHEFIGKCQSLNIRNVVDKFTTTLQIFMVVQLVKQHRAPFRDNTSMFLTAICLPSLGRGHGVTTSYYEGSLPQYLSAFGQCQSSINSAMK